MKSVTFLLMFWLLLNVVRMYGQYGPGWQIYDPDPGIVMSVEEFEALQSQGGSYQTQSLSDPEEVEVLPAWHEIPDEIEKLAAGLQYDPVRMFDFVYNYIEYEKYYGYKKGPLLTYYEKKGNDFDQAVLLATLLMASSRALEAQGDPQEAQKWIPVLRFAYVWIPYHLGSINLVNWWGIDENPYADIATYAEVSSALGYQGSNSQLPDYDFLLNASFSDDTKKKLRNSFEILDIMGIGWRLYDQNGPYFVLPHAWVELPGHPDQYKLDPSIKPGVRKNPQDIKAMFAYNEASLLGQTAMNEITGGLNGTGGIFGHLNGVLNGYTNALIGNLRQNDFVGGLTGLTGGFISEYKEINSLEDMEVLWLQSNFVVEDAWIYDTETGLPDETWTDGIPENYASAITLEFYPPMVGQPSTQEPYSHKKIFTAELDARKMSILSTGNHLRLCLDEEIIHQVEIDSQYSEYSLNVTFEHSWIYRDSMTNMPVFDTGVSQDEQKNYLLNDKYAYVLSYAFAGSMHPHRERMYQDYLQTAYEKYPYPKFFDSGGSFSIINANSYLNSLQSGTTDYTDALRLRDQLLTEPLHIIGLKWMEQAYFAETYSMALEGFVHENKHIMGRVSQEENMYIDVSMALDSPYPRNGNIGLLSSLRITSSFVLSAMEHAVFEQNQSVSFTPASTVSILSGISSRSSTPDPENRIYFVSKDNASTSDDWDDFITALNADGFSNHGYTPGDLVNPDCENPTGDLERLKCLYDDGHVLLIPGRKNFLVGDWSGYGYVHADLLSRGRIGMKISGDLNGGYVPIAGIADNQYLQNQINTNTYNWDKTEFLKPIMPLEIQYFGADPVNLATGAFVTDKTDLSAGIGSAPRSLSFTRYYDSNRGSQNRTGLGHGWTHSYFSSVETISDYNPVLGKGTGLEAAPMLVALAVMHELQKAEPNAQRWLATALVADWLADQLVNNVRVVTLGNSARHFTRMPDGSYVSPAGVSETLSGNDGSYVLQQRHGNTYRFNSEDRLHEIEDVHGNLMELAYEDGKLDEVTDAYNRKLKFNYTGPLLTSVEEVAGPLPRSVRYGHDGYNNLTTITDPESKVWKYDYKQRNKPATFAKEHKITKVINAKGQVMVESLYDSKGRVYEQYSEGKLDRKWRIYYGGVSTVEENPLGERKTYYYDIHGRGAGEKDALGNRTFIEYDGQNNVVKLKDARGKEWLSEYNFDNNLTKQTEPMGHIVEYTYDSEKRLYQKIESYTDADQNPRTLTTTYNYTDQHQLKKVTDASSIVTAEYEYYASGDPELGHAANKGLLKLSTDGQQKKTKFTHDSYGHPDLTYLPDDTPTDWGDNLKIDSTYNERGDLTYQLNEKNVSQDFTYDNRRLLKTVTDSVGLLESRIYDAAGNLESITNRHGDVVQYKYSPTRKMLGTKHPNKFWSSHVYDVRDYLERSEDAMFRGVTHGYDEAGRLESVTDDKNITVSYDYDQNGNRTGITNGLDKTWTQLYDDANRLTYIYYPGSRWSRIQYHVNGWIHTAREPSGQIATFRYFDNGRLQSKTDSIGAISYTYFGDGTVQTVTEGTKTITRAYDPRQRLTTQTHNANYIDTGAKTVSYNYLDAQNKWSITYPGGKTVTYSYNSAGRLTEVASNSGKKVTYNYNHPQKRLQSVSWPNTMTRWFSYDNAGRVTSLNDFIGGGGIQNWSSYVYDNAGSLIGEETAPVMANQTNAPTMPSMEYHEDNRLEKVNDNSVTVNNAGNLTLGPLTNPSANVSYTYNARNQLTGVDGWTFVYDAEGRRIRQYKGTTDYRYVWGNIGGTDCLLQRIDKHSSVTRNYIYSPSGVLLFEETSDGYLFVYHGDIRGSVTAISDVNGNVVARYLYSPYGHIAYSNGSHDTPFKFVGLHGVETDPSSLYRMRARYYNPVLRRFITEDPIGFAGGLNWYGYAAGNPISFIDPLGWVAEQLETPWAPGTSSWGTQALDGAQSILDFVGLVPGIGEFADGLNAGIYLIRGDYVNAALSTTAMVPVLGWGATGTKVTVKYSDDLLAQAQKQYPGKAGNIELHHIEPKYLGGDPNGPTVPLDAAYHQQITNAFRDAWKYGQGKPLPQQVQKIMDDVYSKYPLP